MIVCLVILLAIVTSGCLGDEEEKDTRTYAQKWIEDEQPFIERPDMTGYELFATVPGKATYPDNSYAEYTVEYYGHVDTKKAYKWSEDSNKIEQVGYIYNGPRGEALWRHMTVQEYLDKDYSYETKHEKEYANYIKRKEQEEKSRQAIKDEIEYWEDYYAKRDNSTVIKIGNTTIVKK